MNVTLEIQPELETRVRAQAEARGLPVDQYLRSVIEEATLTPIAPPLTLDEHEKLLDELASGLGHIRVPVEDAFSRASIYADHD